MKAWTLAKPAPVEKNPLQLSELPVPEPADGEVLVRVTACGICRTDLHVVEGELPPRQRNIVPGHQIVGVIERSGRNAQRNARGVRVGIPWLHKTCGQCSDRKSTRLNSSHILLSRMP